MPEPMGLTEFFAMEAGDYLERLDAVVSQAQEPDRAEFVRLARALRGSALMANQPDFAAAAGGLERLARAVHGRSRRWDPATKQLAVRSIDDLKILVRKVSAWSAADSQKAKQLAATLQEALGGAQPPAPTPKTASPGQRAIVAQQGAGLASALDQAASALAQNPQAQHPLQAVHRTMLPLRGIASLADHPPLPDLLDGIERAVAELTARGGAAPPAAPLFRAAAQAVSKAAQQIGAKGQADVDAPEAHEFARLLGTLLGLGADVVPIESLYYQDAGPHVVQEGQPPAGGTKLGSLELVSHGEHLRQAADALERAQSAVQRELRAHALLSTFRSLASAGSGALGKALTQFVQAAREVLAGGRAVREPATFARHMRDAGATLSGAAAESEAAIAQRLGVVTALLRGAAGGTLAPPPAPARPAGRTMPPPKPPPTPAAPPPPPAAPVTEEAPGLVGSYQRFDHLVATLGLGPASLDELLAGPPLAGAAVAVAGGADQEVVSIATLCYSGEAALARALSLREQVHATMAGASPDGAALRELLEEIFDLVQLGADSES